MTLRSLLLLGLTLVTINAQAINLGTAAVFAVLGASGVTNTGPTVINGDLGVSPGTSITGFPPGIINGIIHNSDAVALIAQNDATTAYNVAAGLPFSPGNDLTGQNLGGRTLVPAVYHYDSSAGLTGTLTLDGNNNPNSVFVFQIGSTLITGTGSAVVLTNGAQACNVFWQVGSSATLGTGTVFSGNILALASITVNSGDTNAGGLYALTGAVTMINDVINAQPLCVNTIPNPNTSTSISASSSTGITIITSSISPSTAAPSTTTTITLSTIPISTTTTPTSISPTITLSTITITTTATPTSISSIVVSTTTASSITTSPSTTSPSTTSSSTASSSTASSSTTSSSTASSSTSSSSTSPSLTTSSSTTSSSITTSSSLTTSSSTTSSSTTSSSATSSSTTSSSITTSTASSSLATSSSMTSSSATSSSITTSSSTTSLSITTSTASSLSATFSSATSSSATSSSTTSLIISFSTTIPLRTTSSVPTSSSSTSSSSTSSTSIFSTIASTTTSSTTFNSKKSSISSSYPTTWLRSIHTTKELSASRHHTSSTSAIYAAQPWGDWTWRQKSYLASISSTNLYPTQAPLPHSWTSTIVQCTTGLSETPSMSPVSTTTSDETEMMINAPSSSSLSNPSLSLISDLSEPSVAPEHIKPTSSVAITGDEATTATIKPSSSGFSNPSVSTTPLPAEFTGGAAILYAPFTLSIIIIVEMYFA